jgi:iron complex outermembrane receptor protein
LIDTLLSQIIISKKMKYLHMVLLCLSAFSSASQVSFRGVINDNDSGSPVSHASLYFPELHLGIGSSDNGTFDLRMPKNGAFLLQVSHIGYENFFLTIELPRDTIINITLKQSVIPMPEVVVTGTRSQAPQQTTFHIGQITAQRMRESGALSISDAVARIPGVSQLTTGSGISKPVIRGMYGNRIQVNVNGMRFDNQQWQDEHGLGLSDMGVDRVEIIKGPASVVYGSDAIGGVLNVIEEKPIEVNKTEQNFSARAFSNTLGTALQYGLRQSKEKKWFRLNAGIDSHGDYSDGNNNRVLNSRFVSYNLKSGFGSNTQNRSTANHLFISYSKFGFVFDSLSRKEQDARWSRSFDGPHHQVFFTQATSENTFLHGDKKIKFNAGLISNLRQEDEGGGGISLSMLLNSLNATGQLLRKLHRGGDITLGASAFAQTNTNFGGRIIVPDAFTGEGSLFGFYHLTRERFLAEVGLRVDERFITTYATKSLNIESNDSPTHEVLPFSRAYSAMNFSIGAGHELLNGLTIKGNASTGYRPGNLAELSSNGLHEGTLRWEIGKPDAKVEQNMNTEVTATYRSQAFRISASGYTNRFHNYIYLTPTGKEYFGFQIYHFEQTNATIKGGEIEGNWNPVHSQIAVTASYSYIASRKQGGEPLPFIPANKLQSQVSYLFTNITSVRFGGTYVFAQDHPAEFETRTSDYILFEAGATWQRPSSRFFITCNNLFNNNYYDHLSRFKYYGIANMGRNIVVGVNFNL